MGEREDLYAQATGGVDPTETEVKDEEEKKEEEKPDTSAEKEETSEVKEEDKTSEETTDETKEEVIDETKPKEKGDLKLALKEEREKRRTIKRELEAKIAEQERQFNELIQSVKGKPESQEEQIGDYETELKNLRQKVTEFDKWRETVSVKSEEEIRQKSYKELMLRIEGTDKELEKDGYPGFTKFKSLISEELNKLTEDERSEMDNEEGWKELYKETVFPSIKPLFQSITKAEKDAEKIADKKKLGMLGESKGEQKIAKEDTWSMEDYVAMRRKQGGG